MVHGSEAMHKCDEGYMSKASCDELDHWYVTINQGFGKYYGMNPGINVYMQTPCSLII